MSEADPPYVRIADGIRRRIVAGELRPGERVPSTRAIVRDWGVALATATRALDVLRQEGLVRSVPRVGTVVATPEIREPGPAGRAPETRAPRRPGPSRVLARDEVVSAAVGIADADGLDALSMRAVAGQLGVPTMSLYRHVRGKDDLVLMMIEASFAEDPFPVPAPHGWRARLEVAARLQWTSYRRHPWLAQVVSLTRPQPVVNLWRHGEWILDALQGHGLDVTELFDVHMTLCNYVRGIAVNLAPEAAATADTGMTGDEWADVDASIRALVGSGRFPTLQRVTRSGGYDLDLDALFEFGLRHLLDGLTGFVEGLAGRVRRG